MQTQGPVILSPLRAIIWLTYKIQQYSLSESKLLTKLRIRVPVCGLIDGAAEEAVATAADG